MPVLTFYPHHPNGYAVQTPGGMPFKNVIQTGRDQLSFYGWRMVLVGCLFRLLGGGFHCYGFTVFALPLGKDLGINRAATGLVFGRRSRGVGTGCNQVWSAWGSARASRSSSVAL